MEMLFTLIDYVLFAFFALSVFYLFFFAIFSLRKRKHTYPLSKKQHRFLVLFPAYKEDRVITHSVKEFLKQNYPREMYDLVVISDQMKDETNKALENISAKVLKIDFEDSSKAKALNFAINSLPDQYDMVAIMDGDNIAEADFLEKINDAYYSGVRAVQVHRAAKNTNTETAVLDAASEEINNSIFRKGQVHFGFSAALSGSGMAFDYNWFSENIKLVNSSGEDKEIEALLIQQQIFIEYLEDVVIYDEKTQSSSAFYNQRRRWLASQYAVMKKSLKDLPKAIRTKNIDYCNKIMQWIMLPRVLLLGGIIALAIVALCISWTASIKWWGLLIMLIFTFAIAIPDELINKGFTKALIRVPWLFLLMFLNLFRLRGANKKFNPTEHTH